MFGLWRFEVDLRRVGSVQKIFARGKLSFSLRSRWETTSLVNGTLANLFQHFTLLDFSRKFCWSNTLNKKLYFLTIADRTNFPNKFSSLGNHVLYGTYLWFWANRSWILWRLTHREIKIRVIVVDVYWNRVGRLSKWRYYVTDWWRLFFFLHYVGILHFVWIWWSLVRRCWCLNVFSNYFSSTFYCSGFCFYKSHWVTVPKSQIF